MNTQNFAVGNACTMLRSVLRESRLQVTKKWLECLKAHPEYRSDIQPENFDYVLNKTTMQLFSNLIDSTKVIEKKELEGFLKKIRQTDYSIIDLFIEMNCFQNAVEEVLFGKYTSDQSYQQGLSELSHLRNSFAELGQLVLKNTSLFYELSIEKGITGFCQIDPNGVIIFANNKFISLAENENLKGMPFDIFFSGAEQDRVRRVLRRDSDDIQLIQQVQWKSLNNKTMPVGLELAPIIYGESCIGSYAKITDLTKPIEMQNRIFDEFLLGIVRLDKKLCIKYANKSFRELLGLDCQEWKGMNFFQLIPDEKNRQIVKDQLRKRFEGKSDEYNVDLFRKDDRRRIPVRISASPETDLDRNVIGTMGIVRSMVRENMQAHIENLKNADDLLHSISIELLSVVHFDRIDLGLFTSDMKRARRLFSFSFDEGSHLDRRWWEMTPAMIQWAKQRDILPVPSVKKFYDDPKFSHLKSEPFVKEIIKKYKSFLYYPIFQDEKVTACVVFYSKSEKPYAEGHRFLLQNVPLDVAVMTALYLEEKANLKFLIDLVESISLLEDNLEAIAQKMCEEIASHYKWENVSIFRLDRQKKKFYLLSQFTVEDKFKIPEDYDQKMTEGVLGLALEEKKPINVEDVHDPRWKNIYITTVPATRSELCIPIKSGDLFWLLNIEDRVISAFSEQEIQSIQSLIRSISVFLERAWLKNFLDKSIQTTSDSVISTDLDGNIKLANKAALKILKYKENELTGKPLSTIMVDPAVALQITNEDKIPNTKVTFRTQRGDEVKMLLSKFQLHEEFSTNILFAKELETQERLEELNYLRKLYNELAFQTKTPLTLVFSWLNQLRKQNTEPKKNEMIDKARQQLRRIELSINRLALYDSSKSKETSLPYNDMLFSVSEIWDQLSYDLPETDFNRIKIMPPNYDFILNGDLFQVTFCFESVLSYLLRGLPESEEIVINLSTDEKESKITITGKLPSVSPDRSESESPERSNGERRIAAGQAIWDLALGEEIVEKFIINNSGVYQRKIMNGKSIKFDFTFKQKRGLKNG